MRHAGGDENHAACRRSAQQWIKGAKQPPIGRYIDRKYVVPTFRIDMMERRERSENAGVADQRVEPAPPLVDSGAETIESCKVAQIDRDQSRWGGLVWPERTNLVVEFFERALGARHGDHMRAVGRER